MEYLRAGLSLISTISNMLSRAWVWSKVYLIHKTWSSYRYLTFCYSFFLVNVLKSMNSLTTSNKFKFNGLKMVRVLPHNWQIKKYKTVWWERSMMLKHLFKPVFPTSKVFPSNVFVFQLSLWRVYVWQANRKSLVHWAISSLVSEVSNFSIS